MRAVTIGPNGVQFTDRWPIPRSRTGETLIRVLGAGLCETDMQLVRGYMGFQGVPGHEFVGVAETGVWKGRRVVGEINCGCGQCEDCTSGRRNHCASRTVLGILNHDGAFADYLSLPTENLLPVPDTVSDIEAVFVEPLAAAFQIPAQLALRPGMAVTVIGDGRLGNLCAQVLRLAECRTTVVGKHPRKLSLLTRMGIPNLLLDNLDVRRSADLVVDCTGSPSGLQLALQLVRPRGTIVLKTTVAGEQTLALAPIVIDEVTIVGSRCGPFVRALQGLERREIDVRPLVEEILPIEQAASAFERAANEPLLKLLLAVDAGFGSS